MTHELPGLRWRPHWTSHLGCLQACAEWLELGLSPGWLAGGGGHAFAVNIHPQLCPSGPTAWHTDSILPLLANVGVGVTMWHADRQEVGFAATCRVIEASLKGCLRCDLPCYGWAVQIPEWYCFHGYDDDGLYFSGCSAMEGAGPRALADLEWPGIDVAAVAPCPPQDDEAVVVRALRYALEHARGAYSGGDYSTGPAAFEQWAAALEAGTASRNGHSYNAACWGECREYAVRFLTEARVKLSGRANGPLDAAIAAYATVAEELGSTHRETGFQPNFEPTLQSLEAAGHVRRAGTSEARALEAVAAAVEAFEA